MNPNWKSKTDPEKHPVRFLASIWQQKMQANFGISVSLTGKEWGQLKTLKEYLGDITQDVIEWVVDPVNWFFFCQQIRADRKNHRICQRPDIGLLLLRRDSALRVMRSKLSNSVAGAAFIKKLDQREFEQMKTLLLAAYSQGKPERQAKIHSAKTLESMQKVFNEIMDESKAESAGEIPLLKKSA